MAGRQAGRQAGGQAGRQVGRQAGRHAGRQAAGRRLAGVQAGKQASRQAGRQASRQASKQAGRQAARQPKKQAGSQASRQPNGLKVASKCPAERSKTLQPLLKLVKSAGLLSNMVLASLRPNRSWTCHLQRCWLFGMLRAFNFAALGLLMNLLSNVGCSCLQEDSSASQRPQSAAMQVPKAPCQRSMVRHASLRKVFVKHLHQFVSRVTQKIVKS